MKKLMRNLVMIVTFLAFVLVVPQAQAVTVEEIQDRGKVIMGTSPDFPPFEWVDMSQGEPKVVGVDVEIAQKIADELGVELEIVETTFDSLIQQAKSGKIDMALAGMTYTEERAKQVLFSDIYYETNSRFLVRAEDADKYTSLDDFKNAKIGVQKGNSQEILAKEKFPEAELTSMNKNGDLVEALKAGRVDAVLFDGIVTESFHQQNPNTTAKLMDLQVEENPDGSAIVTDLDSQELMDVINKVLQELKDSGELEDIFNRNVKLAEETGAN
ncbi:transporter substrate-binding domain-containing protein [Hutsoniella sourekii]